MNLISGNSINALPWKAELNISIICPVFNSDPALLQQATHSAITACEAAGVSAELILVDDGSTNPNTREALRMIGEGGNHVRIIRHEGNLGPASARNLGLAAASGTWIGFLDADDLWLPDRMAACHELMQRPDVSWIGGRHCTLEADGTMRPGNGLHEALHSAPAAKLSGRALTFALLANFWMHLGATLVRRDLARRIGGFREGLYYYEDFLFLARLSVVAPLHLVDAEVYAWRQGDRGLTASPHRLASASLQMFRQAARDPLLADYRRELRWARYSATKGLALNNLLAQRRWQALRLAFEAWRIDPREIGDFWRFVGLCAQGAETSAERGERYSRAQRFALRGQDPTSD